MTRLACLLLLTSATMTSAAEPQWNQFRGGRGDGTSKAAGIPIAWSETKNVRWKTEIWGKGWSSPIVWKDRIWLTTATEDGHRLALLCLDRKTGKILHDKTLFEHEKPQYCHPFNSYASPTPWVEDSRIYVTFGALGTACLDTETLRVIWKREDLQCNHWRGPGSSVSIYKNLFFLPFDGHDHQFVLAFDKRNGKTVWRNDRNIDYKSDNGDIKKAYCTARRHQEGLLHGTGDHLQGTHPGGRARGDGDNCLRTGKRQGIVASDPRRDERLHSATVRQREGLHHHQFTVQAAGRPARRQR